MSFSPEVVIRSAEISACGYYRYRLSRSWDSSLPCLLFIMLNPSTADAIRDDPTIRRCMGFAHDLGFGSVLVGNLFAWRSSNPADLVQAADPAGPENQLHLEKMAAESTTILCGWGNGPILRKLGDKDGRRYLPPALLERPLQVLDLSRSGIPAHPLYLKGGKKYFAWNPEERNYPMHNSSLYLSE